MSEIWQQNTPLLDAANAAHGYDFSQYLPVGHSTPTPYRTDGYSERYPGQFLPGVNAFNKAYNPPWIRPWFNDPSRFVWDEDNHCFRCFAISASNPEDKATGGSTWMEIVSPDLCTFVNNRLPFYIDPLPYPALWGGSFLIDRHNAAGYGAGAILYYISIPGSDTSPLQCVSLWTAPALGTAPVYHGVVLENPGVGGIVHAPGMDFRDPRVDWDEEHNRFVMKLTIGRGIVFYGSTDGLNWSFLSLIDLSDWQQIETPDLVPMTAPDGSRKWLLAFSMKQWEGKAASTVGYLTGSWDGTTFTPDYTTPKRLNWGSDYYAQAISQHEGRTYCWGWQGNWNYMPLPQQGFSGNNSLVTELTLAKDRDGTLGLRYGFLPDQRLQYARQKDVFNVGLLSNTGWSPVATPGVSWRLDLELYRDAPAAWSDSIIVDFCSNGTERLRLILAPNAGTATLDRSHSGAGPLNLEGPVQTLWQQDQVATLPLHTRYAVTLVYDVSSVEILINNELYLSSLAFPSEDAFSMSVSATGTGMARLNYARISY